MKFDPYPNALRNDEQAFWGGVNCLAALVMYFPFMDNGICSIYDACGQAVFLVGLILDLLLLAKEASRQGISFWSLPFGDVCLLFLGTVVAAPFGLVFIFGFPWFLWRYIKFMRWKRRKGK
jgi:hypothetical protein